jgi:hypothetical protein
MSRKFCSLILALGLSTVPWAPAAPQKGGATHWAFQPIERIEPPADASGWSANAVDRFVVAKLAEHGLRPAGPAERATLIRRATFDLLGLPPTPAEVNAFVADSAPNAYARLIERLLAAPQYGERWGRHWLDVVRYADTGGFEVDHFYPNAWRYRDYVIRSLNADKPFDRFLQEQVAGDELWPEDREAVLATGLYCVGPLLPESVMVDKQLEYDWLTDAADTTGAAFLGLTMGCARCHDHKYDPLTQQDYFSLQAVFAASDRPYPATLRTVRIKALNGMLSEKPLPKELENDPRCTMQVDSPDGLRLVHRREPYTVYRLRRGELSKPREIATPAVPLVLGKADFPAEAPERRRAALARWLTARDNPLTARVLVNRVWGWHFGQALVRTPNDFGTQGELPTHPELLDWLARDFMEHGWSLKHLHRLIMLSNTYQMSSRDRRRPDAGRADIDPQNRWLGHFPRRRLEGETLRDAMLSCAGSLNLKASGPPVVPPLGAQELTGLFDAKNKWTVTKDPTEHTRRSVYILVRRTFAYPLFAAFDPPEVMTSCPQRARTVVPAQALTLLNSPLALELSNTFAQRLLKECRDRPDDIVEQAWRLTFGRSAVKEETERAREFLRERSAALGDTERALAELCQALFNANEFIYVD